MDIRHRDLVYVGDALLETQMPNPNPLTPNPQGKSHNKCKPACIVAASVVGLLIIIGIIVPDTSNDNVPGSSIVVTSPTRTPTPPPTPTPPTYVSVGEILGTFKANPARGKVQYMQEPVYVSGKVRGFNESDSRVVYLTPEATWETEDYEVFLVRLPSLQQAASLSRGDEISMLCKINQGHAFPHGYEIECTPVGTVSTPPMATPSPRPTALPTALSSLPTVTTETTMAVQPASTPTFDERRQAVISKYCGDTNPLQICVNKVGSDYCVAFYESPVEYIDRQAVCTFFGS